VPVDVEVIVLMLVVAVEGFVAQPTAHIGALGYRVIKADVEKESRIDSPVRDRHDRSARVGRLQSCFDRSPCS